jgi:hypothetical protein
VTYDIGIDPGDENDFRDEDFYEECYDALTDSYVDCEKDEDIFEDPR